MSHAHRWWADGAHYMVAADHEAASRAGAEILAAGGNAVDAAVATAFALSVVRQESCGLGGGGFMVIRRPGEKPVALDFRETAPLGAERRHYLDESGRPIPGRTRRGAWAVGVPGTVKGLLLAWERYGSGKMSRQEVLAPAIRLARSPMPVDRHLHESLKTLARDLERSPGARTRFAELARVYLDPAGKAPKIGETLDLGDLAETLEAIARDGAAGFYDGAIGDRILGEIVRLGGPMRREDFEAYQVRTVEPLVEWVGRYRVVAMPPPSSGGAVLIQVLRAVPLPRQTEPWFIRSPGRIGPAEAHVLVEAMKHAFADRATLLGDRSPEVLADVRHMISRERAHEVRAAIDPAKTRPVSTYGLSVVPDDAGTSHLSVVDADGGAVACTFTINLSFGSYVMVPGTGVILNDEMDDFAVDAATPNAFGLRQSERNLIAPGRRPLSSMSPTIVLKDGDVVLVVGASGGPRIISSTLQTMLRTVWGGVPLERAVAEPRLHHQWLPDVIQLQAGFDDEVVRFLLSRGHTIRQATGALGHVQAVARTRQGWRGVSDPDKGGRPVGG